MGLRSSRLAVESASSRQHEALPARLVESLGHPKVIGVGVGDSVHSGVGLLSEGFATEVLEDLPSVVALKLNSLLTIRFEFFKGLLDIAEYGRNSTPIPASQATCLLHYNLRPAFEAFCPFPLELIGVRLRQL